MLTFIVVVIIAATIYAGYRFTKSAPEAIEKRRTTYIFFSADIFSRYEKFEITKYTAKSMNIKFARCA